MITLYYESKINVNDIKYFNQIHVNTSHYPNWGELWAQKNDYLEYQISMLGKKHPLITESSIVLEYFFPVCSSFETTNTT